MTRFFGVIAESSTHIFHSALALAPRTSIVRRLHGRDSSPFVNVVQGIPDSWDSDVASTSRLSTIEAIAWSPCGRLIAITCVDSTTEILHAVTLERLCTMRSFLGARVLAFSPDSRLLVCCGLSIDSLTNFIVSWDVQTGGMVRVRENEEEAKGRPSAITLSTDGGMIGVAYSDPSTPWYFIICVYEIDSGRRVYAHSFDERFIKIWTHGQSFRFATVETGTITVCEVELTSNSGFRSVDTFNIPGIFDPLGSFSFFPISYRLAYVTIVGGIVMIWDFRSGKPILEAKNANFQDSKMSFSSNGHFFACGTAGPDIYLWEECPTGYTLHQKFTSGTPSPALLFSPDETSIVTWDSSTIHLWPWGGPSTPTLPSLSHITERPKRFLLDFLPDLGSVVVARRKSNAVAVLDLKTGVRQLTIDTGMKVFNLRGFGQTVVVEGPSGFVTWTLPVGDSVLGAVMGVEDGIRTTAALAPRRTVRSRSTSVSPDLSQIAIRGTAWRVGDVCTAPLSVYDVSTGVRLAGISGVDGDMAWFSQDGSQVWCGGEVEKERGWRVVKGNGPTQVSLDPLPIGNPPEGYPWRSSRGYTVTDNGWILDPEGKRLLWLPPCWRSYERKDRVWSGPHLALFHDTLPEPVILRLEP